MSRTARSRATYASALALLCIAATAPARAQGESEPPRWDPGRRTTSTLRERVDAPEPGPVTDGVYGRFRGDLDFSLGAGAELARGELRGAARFSVHYFYTAGLYLTYRDAFSAGADVPRALSIGVDMRPAFIPRFVKNMQQGPGALDLALDSISLGLGAFWEQPEQGALGDSRGFETSLGLGVPLLGRATGPWLETRGQLAFRGTESAEGQLLVLLSFHALVLSPLARSQ